MVSLLHGWVRHFCRPGSKKQVPSETEFITDIEMDRFVFQCLRSCGNIFFTVADHSAINIGEQVTWPMAACSASAMAVPAVMEPIRPPVPAMRHGPVADVSSRPASPVHASRSTARASLPPAVPEPFPPACLLQVRRCAAASAPCPPAARVHVGSTAGAKTWSCDDGCAPCPHHLHVRWSGFPSGFPSCYPALDGVP